MSDAMHNAWDLGQRQLAAGRYTAARDALVSAEAAAWETRDAASLARIYLPLLEARRQIRYLAAEGRIEISPREILTSADRGIQERLLIAGQSIAAHGAPDCAFPIQWTGDESAAIGPSTDPALVVPLPHPGVYDGRRGIGAVARESILIAWEALALKWQRLHPLAPSHDPWAELAWLREALTIDPACEPISMRLISLAEGIERAAG
jgi:hypothetical protein